MHKIMEMEAKMEAMKSCCETMMGWVKAEMCKTPDCIDIGQLGEAVDIVKDFKEAERDCWQACFYKLMCEELEEEAECGNDRMGYVYKGVRLPRYPYVPSDTTMAEYETMRQRMGEKGAMWPDPRYDNPRMGYGNPDRTTGNRRDQDGWEITGGEYNMGYRGQPRDSYGQYKMARRNYTNTHSEEDKREMNRHAEDHMKEVEDTLGDIWATADPEMKKKMKAELTKLVDGMKI